MSCKGDYTMGGEHTIQDTGDVLQNCKLETYLINQGNPIDSITFKKVNKYFPFKKTPKTP